MPPTFFGHTLFEQLIRLVPIWGKGQVLLLSAVVTICVMLIVGLFVSQLNFSDADHPDAKLLRDKGRPIKKLLFGGVSISIVTPILLAIFFG